MSEQIEDLSHAIKMVQKNLKQTTAGMAKDLDAQDQVCLKRCREFKEQIEIDIQSDSSPRKQENRQMARAAPPTVGNVDEERIIMRKLETKVKRSQEEMQEVVMNQIESQ